MKSLKDAILEKLKVDDIIINEKFPINGTINDIIAFLEDAGFTYVFPYKGIDVEFDRYKCKCFHYSGDRFWFADTSKEKISKKNPIFLIKSISNKWVFSVYYTTYGAMTFKIEDDKKEFLKELNKRFGWK